MHPVAGADKPVLSHSGRRLLVAVHASVGACLLVVTLLGLLPGFLGRLLAVSFAVAALYHVFMLVRSTMRRRAEADSLLVAIDTERVPDPLRWRAAELTGRRQRRALARALSNLLKSLELPPSLSPVPVNRQALRRNRRVVEALVERLRAFDRPVRPRGILLVRQLLGDGHRSPLYDLDASRELQAALVRVCAEIEP